MLQEISNEESRFSNYQESITITKQDIEFVCDDPLLKEERPRCKSYIIMVICSNLSTYMDSQVRMWNEMTCNDLWCLKQI